jgi:hypothetical protein
MEAKDKKYYSNPSNDPNFGKNSPPVPTSLLEKLAAMKIQTPKDNDQQQNNQQQSTPMQTHQLQTSSSVQEKVMMLNAHNQITHTNNNLQIAGISTNGNQQPEGTIQHQVTPAKRQKMEAETTNNNDTTHMDYQRVGRAQQASPKP